MMNHDACRTFPWRAATFLLAALLLIQTNGFSIFRGTNGIPAPPGMVSWWRCDGNAQDVGDRNHGRLAGGGRFGEGVNGQALTFDGVDGIALMPSGGLPIGHHDRAMVLWCRIDSIVAEESFFAGYGNYGQHGETYELGATWGRLFFSQWGDAIIGPRLQCGVWYHVAASSNDGVTTLYLNGVAVGNADLELDTPAGSLFTIGKVDGPYGAIRRLNGSVDEVSVY